MNTVIQVFISVNIELLKQLRLIAVVQDEIMAYKWMYISNFDEQKHPFSRLQLVVETFKHSTL